MIPADAMVRPRAVLERIIVLDPSPITLPVNCVHCGRPVTLQFSDLPTVFNIESIWTCPYSHCPVLEGQRIEFPGELMDIWCGHGPAPE